MKDKWALISVYNKKNLHILAPVIDALGYRIISTSGTGEVLRSLNIDFILAKNATQNPERFTDCIQTISYYICAGILFDRNNKDHVRQLQELHLKQIDIVVCNFPPVDEVIHYEDEFNITRVDVGGPLMLRAAATNYPQVLAVADPNTYDEVAKRLKMEKLDLSFRRKLAMDAFIYCSQYDVTVANKLKAFAK